MNVLLRVVGCPGFVVALQASTVAYAQALRAPPTPVELEQEVLENVRNQPLGDGTVADLALPEEFLRRVADRIVRSSYEDRYRIIVEDGKAPPVDPGAGPTRNAWIAITAACVALVVVGWASIARRRGRDAP